MANEITTKKFLINSKIKAVELKNIIDIVKEKIQLNDD